MQLSILVRLSIFDWIFGPIAVLFGWLTRILYSFFGSFGLAIIFLTVIVRGLTVPLNVRSAKAMMKQQALSNKQMEIKRKYADDKKMQEQELQKLFQENGISSFAGCLTPLLPIFFLFPTYYIVRCPLQYIMGVSKSNISEIGELLSIKSATADNISVINRLTSDAKAMSQVVNKGLIKLEQIPDMKFLGMDLGRKPAWLPTDIIKEPSVYVPLLIIPLLVLLTTVLQNMLIAATKPDAKKQKEERKRAKNNPANNQPDDPTARTTKIMNLVMPAIMLVTTFAMPAAFGFYWIIGNLMGMLQQVLTYYMFSKPYEEKKKELEEQKKLAFKKNKQELATETAGAGKKKKK
ncbi:MAG: membrane protein insertase YidC [Clostridiales bacterium]|nr:membrane protein insertase YidC [Clostridiales bacterium]